MAMVTLIHPQERVEVSGRTLFQKSDLFAANVALGASPYTLKSEVSLADFRDFVALLKGQPVTITNGNFRGLSQLCQEFGFQDLGTQFSEFRDSSNFKEDSEARCRLCSLEERMQRHDREIELLHAELSRQLRVQESLGPRIRTEVESASRRVNEVEKSVAEVRSEVENVREAFREVRELAEGAQKKAASTEARFEAAAIYGVCGTFQRSWSTIFPKDFSGFSAFWGFVAIFEDFKQQKFSLLWRGSRDGFKAQQFHTFCDGHPNTLTLILDTDGNVFGGFTPVEWELGMGMCKADPSLKSFLFTLMNPHNVPARRFALNAERKDEAIYCWSDCGPHFCDIVVSDDCNTNTKVPLCTLAAVTLTTPD
jgi:hypothetical protein